MLSPKNPSKKGNIAYFLYRVSPRPASISVNIMMSTAA